MDLATLSALAQDLADHRVVTAADLRAHGADGSALYVARHRGILQDLPGMEGTYVVGKEPYDDLVRMHAASAWAGPGSIISGLHACRLLELPWVPTGGRIFTRIPATNKRRDAGGFVTICRTNELERIGTWEHEGLLVADVPDAVVDACRQVQSQRIRHVDQRLREVRGLVLGATGGKRCSPEQLESSLSHGSIRDTALTRRSVVDARRGAASPPEAEVVDALLGRGVPFFCNVEVHVRDALVAVLDFYLVGTGVGGEMDSKQEHEEGVKLDATLLRHKAVEGFGFDVHHITPTRYRAHPEGYLDTLFRAARARLARGLGDPPDVVLRPRGPLLCGPRSSLTPYTIPEAA